MYRGELGTVCEEPEEKEFQRSIERSGYFVDDVSGKVLDDSLVKHARLDEREGVYKHNIFGNVQSVNVLAIPVRHPSAQDGWI